MFLRIVYGKSHWYQEFSLLDHLAITNVKDFGIFSLNQTMLPFVENRFANVLINRAMIFQNFYLFFILWKRDIRTW